MALEYQDEMDGLAAADGLEREFTMPDGTVLKYGLVPTRHWVLVCVSGPRLPPLPPPFFSLSRIRVMVLFIHTLASEA